MIQAVPKPTGRGRTPEGSLGGEGPPEEGGGPSAPRRAPQSGGPMLGKGVPMASGSKNQQELCLPFLVGHKVARNPDSHL